MFDFNFDWRPDMETKIDSIDTQHKQLFKIGRDIEQLLQFKCIGVTDKQLLDIVCELRDFTGYHFYEEESLMKEFEYPEMKQHQAMHGKFAKMITMIDMPMLKANPEAELKKIRDQIQESIFNHILSDDMRMAEYILSKKSQKTTQKSEKAEAEDIYIKLYGEKICELDVTRVYLLREQSYKGRVILIFKDKAKDFLRLAALERNIFYSDVARVTKAIKKICAPQSFDYATYSDIETQFHMHIVPKYENKEGWKEPFQVNPDKVFLPEEEYMELVEAIRKELK